MFQGLLYSLIDWIQALYYMMDGIVLIESGDLIAYDLTLFDVYVDFIVVALIIQCIFGLRSGVDFDIDEDMSHFYWDDD